ncbi:MAG: hypothetical protein HYX80_08065 [Chloroflexi bacterium]|nr:hypothetical protein [Chloroflexota bacterium]
MADDKSLSFSLYKREKPSSIVFALVFPLWERRIKGDFRIPEPVLLCLSSPFSLYALCYNQINPDRIGTEPEKGDVPTQQPGQADRKTATGQIG